MKSAESEASGSNWRKSSRSVGNGACVEVATQAGAVGVRDSVIGDTSPVLSYAPQAWAAFIGDIRDQQR